MCERCHQLSAHAMRREAVVSCTQISQADRLVEDCLQPGKAVHSLAPLVANRRFRKPIHNHRHYGFDM